MSATVRCALALVASLPAIASAAANADAPIASAIVQPAPVTCFVALTGVTSGAATAFIEDIASTIPLANMRCPAGVTSIDVTRVAFHPYGAIASKNIVQSVIAVGLHSKASFGFPISPFVTLSLGTPEGSPAEPVRPSIRSADGIMYQMGWAPVTE